MKVDIDALCHKGLVRDNNEDALSVGGFILRDSATKIAVDTPEEGSFYLLVSDGMGGHEDGEEASAFTLSEIKKLFSDKKIGVETFEDDLRNCTHAISLELNRMAAEKGHGLYADRCRMALWSPMACQCRRQSYLSLSQRYVAPADHRRDGAWHYGKP